MWNFGGGEIAVMYRRAPCNYETERDVSHSWTDGYMSRSDIVLRRSYDHGQTWRAENDVIVWSNAIPLEKKLEFLSQDSGPAQGPGHEPAGGDVLHGRDVAVSAGPQDRQARQSRRRGSPAPSSFVPLTRGTRGRRCPWCSRAGLSARGQAARRHSCTDRGQRADLLVAQQRPRDELANGLEDVSR